MTYHRRPELYHNPRFKSNYFEGWYYKQVSKDQKHVIAFIPGTSFHKGKQYTFIQCIYEKNQESLNAYVFDFGEDFDFDNNPFQVRIRDNSFDLSGFKVDLENDQVQIKGEIAFESLTQLERSILNPNIMGPFSYLPFMECNHGILSMNHNLMGQITIDGEHIDFTGGKGYLEKDWGSSFPKYYSWLQSNHFEDESVSFFCATAHIPVLKSAFNGFICQLNAKGKSYRFATYNKSKLEMIEFTEEKLKLRIQNRKYKLEVEAFVSEGRKLKAPLNGAMNTYIKEALSGLLKIRLWHHSGELILQAQTNCCGIELMPQNR